MNIFGFLNVLAIFNLLPTLAKTQVVKKNNIDRFCGGWLNGKKGRTKGFFPSGAGSKYFKLRTKPANLFAPLCVGAKL